MAWRSIRVLNVGMFVFCVLFVGIQNSAFGYSSSPIISNDLIETEDEDQEAGQELIILPAPPERSDHNQMPQDLEILRDLDVLPRSVKVARDALILAAKSGDAENLRAIIKRQTHVPILSFGDIADPIDHIRETSNDGEGRELLAILIELLEAPFAIQPAENGEPPIYVWPAYAAHSLENLTPEELVDVYEIVSHYDLEEMQLFGGWYFFRVGIDANGEWRYFVAGD